MPKEIGTMWRAVAVRKDETSELLAFSTAEDAQRFMSFGHLYMVESGAGNGYGAYWVSEPTIAETSSETLTHQLDYSRIELMAKSIMRARLADVEAADLPVITYGIQKGGIIFSVEGIPPRQVPQPDDMARCIDPVHRPTKIFGQDWRVLSVVKETATVIQHFDQQEDGTPKPDACTYEMPIAALMKIADWPAKLRQSIK